MRVRTFIVTPTDVEPDSISGHVCQGVIERFHLVEDGKVLEANIHVEDPGAFTMPWKAIQRFRQYEAAARQISNERRALVNSAPEGPLAEQICADNPNSFFPGTSALPIPKAIMPDF